MKSMKRFTALALSLLVMLSLCACGSSNSSSSAKEARGEAAYYAPEPAVPMAGLRHGL